MEQKRDWPALDRKLLGGKPLEEAASEVGIPLEEAHQYVDSRLQNRAAVSYQLRKTAESALATAFEKLTAIANEPPRDRIERLKKAAEGVGVPEHMKVTLYNTDLDAAKALAKLALDALKIGGAAKTDEVGSKRLSVQLDLWDNPGNWSLSKPGV